ncbi:hypothetical protein CWB96_16480 [Pseudoalteromonas citrea]|uniref:Uncharacterized protein n=1 Tax=Pseudoalteromonas citrea TaxID=43655 RepID=A0A5S3XL35_9GAMM|nr:hypothetical protein [Pseudoalteromonas citrea]TMP41228.1 hypothetical protein CWB97_15270 [Pseudoalteromonas citrea]TMP55801.1 hypothetical protein CWB96_16480 [Pseudoalteromonas citrea]
MIDLIKSKLVELIVSTLFISCTTIIVAGNFGIMKNNIISLEPISYESSKIYTYIIPSESSETLKSIDLTLPKSVKASDIKTTGNHTIKLLDDKFINESNHVYRIGKLNNVTQISILHKPVITFSNENNDILKTKPPFHSNNTALFWLFGIVLVTAIFQALISVYFEKKALDINESHHKLKIREVENNFQALNQRSDQASNKLLEIEKILEKKELEVNQILKNSKSKIARIRLLTRTKLRDLKIENEYFKSLLTKLLGQKCSDQHFHAATHHLKTYSVKTDIFSDESISNLRIVESILLDRAKNNET